MQEYPTNQEGCNEDKELPALYTNTRRITVVFTIISVIILLIVLRSVASAFLFACLLATLTWPLRVRLMKFTKNRANLTAGILVFGMISLVGLPFTGIAAIAVSQAQELFTDFKPEQARNWILLQSDRFEKLPMASQLGVTTEKLLDKLQDGISNVATWSMNAVVGVGSNILHTLVFLGITLMSLYYLYVSGEKFVARVKRLLPFPEPQVTELLDTFRRTSKAIFKGSFVVGGTQGLMTGLLFWGTGLPSPAFFGFLSAFASLIPAVGSGLVWAPAALFLAFSGDFLRAIVVVGVGIGLISSIDNILRPVLVGRDAGMHDLMVFLTTVGGLSFFGPMGLLFGPLVGAGTLALLRMYEAYLPKSP